MSSNGTKALPAQNGQPQQPAQEKASPVTIAQTFLNKRITHIEDVLPAGMKGQGERLVKRALLTMSKSEFLMECSIESFYHCVLAAAELGLAIDGKLAHAVPYNNKKKRPEGGEYWVKECQFQIDYKGMVAVARRTKIIKDAFARLVYTDDQFDQSVIDGVCHFKHVPGPKREVVMGAYAVVIMHDGYMQHDWMLARELMAIKARSKAASKGFSPWQTDEGEMQKKTVLKRLLKMFMDSDSYLVAAYIADDDDEVIEGNAAPSVPAEPPTGRVHHNRLTNDAPMPASFVSQGQQERELEPAQQTAPVANGQVQQQQQPPQEFDEEREIKRQELIAWFNDQLSQDRIPAKLLDEVGMKLRDSQQMLGPDVLADMQRRYQAKRGAQDEAFAAPPAGRRNF